MDPKNLDALVYDHQVLKEILVEIRELRKLLEAWYLKEYPPKK